MLRTFDKVEEKLDGQVSQVVQCHGKELLLFPYTRLGFSFSIVVKNVVLAILVVWKWFNGDDRLVVVCRGLAKTTAVADCLRSNQMIRRRILALVSPLIFKVYRYSISTLTGPSLK
jgi:hypothetical protein